MVLHLVTAADGAETHYTCENNTARTETPERACDLDKKAWGCWAGHSHHVRVDNSTDFAGKMQTALDAVLLHAKANLAS